MIHIDLTILFIDLDDFKSINDTFGHDNGDLALCHIANCLNSMKRDSDIVARFAGDEFMVILPSTNKTQAQNYVKGVEYKLSNEPLFSEGTSFHLKFSHGLACVFEKGMEASAILLKAADKRL